MRTLLALAVLCSLVLTGPARAANRTVGISTFEFRPARLAIATGDLVTWRWDGPDTDHSVTAGAFDSDPGLAPGAIDHPVGFTFSQTFPRPGTYRYSCKVHPSMRGVVVVRSRHDRSAPRVRSLRVIPGAARDAIHIRFVLSERARVLLRIATPRHPRRPVRSRTLPGRRGANGVRVLTRGLPPGRYRLTLTATDAAGNASAPARRSFRIRRASPSAR